jgi:hypothetical protein
MRHTGAIISWLGNEMQPKKKQKTIYIIYNWIFFRIYLSDSKNVGVHTGVKKKMSNLFLGGGDFFSNIWMY